MRDVFRAVKITDNVYWVGVIDWKIRDFHGYLTPKGTTYNSYLVMADKITLLDAVKKPFVDELLARISSVVDPEKIDYIVSNHSEPDHTSGLGDVIERVQPEKVFASTIGAKTLVQHYHFDREITAVKDGDTLDLGNMELTFLETRMLHWPDSMMSYLAKDELLISQDAFGMHLASGERFADEIEDETLRLEGEKYFANILMPYAPLITKLLGRVQEMGIPIKMIAPDHGPIWRKPEDIQKVLAWYARWSDQKPTCKAVIIFDTMWESTALMARALHEGLTAGGVSSQLMSLGACHRSEIATEVLGAGAILVGSPTLNNNLFPTVADLLTYLKGLKPKNLLGLAFGSYGWSGEGVGLLQTELDAMKVTKVAEPFRVKFVPDAAVLKECRSLGTKVAEELKKVCDA